LKLELIDYEDVKLFSYFYILKFVNFTLEIFYLWKFYKYQLIKIYMSIIMSNKCRFCQIYSRPVYFDFH